MRLGDFIKVDMRDSTPSGEQEDFAIKITLRGKEGGHAAIIYYGETEKKYYWYDPYSSRDGLFSTDDYRSFVRGVADKLVEYQAGGRFSYFQFTAYKL